MTDNEANKITEVAYQSDGPIEEFEQVHWKCEQKEKGRKVIGMKKHSDPMDFSNIVILLARIATIMGALLLIGLGVLLGTTLHK